MGRIVNLSGAPGFVRPCDYKASVCEGNVSVRIGPLFTVVTVNDLDVYFHRLTGTIDGVGLSQISDCKRGRVEQSSGLDAPLSALSRQVQTESQSERDE